VLVLSYFIKGKWCNYGGGERSEGVVQDWYGGGERSEGVVQDWYGGGERSEGVEEE